MIVVPRVFEGPLHSRCYSYWDRLPFGVTWIEPQGTHERNLAAAYHTARDAGARVAIITEHDFLLVPNAPQIAEELLAGHDILACQYLTRDGAGPILPEQVPGAYFLTIDMSRVHTCPDFGGRDPGNRLHLQHDVKMMPGTDGPWPGVSWPVGTHLFWSRHWADPPETMAAGVRMGDVQTAVDRILKGRGL